MQWHDIFIPNAGWNFDCFNAIFEAARLASLIGESGECGLIDLGDRGYVSGAVGIGRRQLH